MHKFSQLLVHELLLNHCTLIKLSCLDVWGEIDRIPWVSFSIVLQSTECLVTMKGHARCALAYSYLNYVHMYGFVRRAKAHDA